MIVANIDKGQCRLTIKGGLKQIMAESCTLIIGICNSIREKNENAGEIMKQYFGDPNGFARTFSGIMDKEVDEDEDCEIDECFVRNMLETLKEVLKEGIQ